ncbi:hypothetical protein RRG08_015861 [Elysia crispata]|uniref:Uncharacterized protein n=1 Tax=Elysia crispata TaxID=231223 RepID=A0AAE0XPV6_9GAST|nr:hypothetical protein RRG08_015861 [Elysia crispata]
MQKLVIISIRLYKIPFALNMRKTTRVPFSSEKTRQKGQVNLPRIIRHFTLILQPTSSVLMIDCTRTKPLNQPYSTPSSWSFGQTLQLFAYIVTTAAQHCRHEMLVGHSSNTTSAAADRGLGYCRFHWHLQDPLWT